jgi:hypothetical protein
MPETRREERIVALAARLHDSFAPCGFAGNAEAETMIVQTMKACAFNLEYRGEAFSFKRQGAAARGGHGLVDNPRGLRILFERGWLTEEPRPDIAADADALLDADGDPLVLRPTDALLDALEARLDEARDRGDGGPVMISETATAIFAAAFVHKIHNPDPLCTTPAARSDAAYDYAEAITGLYLDSSRRVRDRDGRAAAEAIKRAKNTEEKR